MYKSSKIYQFYLVKEINYLYTVEKAIIIQLLINNGDSHH
jgi:hypothetical protein